MRNLLLISSSKTHGTGFLEHAAQAVQQHLKGVDRIVFIPYALANRDSYARLAAKSFNHMGFELDSLHQSKNPKQTVEQAEAIFTGGGNTFRLLKTLYEFDLLDSLRSKVASGMPYMGSSAGTNIACPTIRTTNDMPIVQPPSFAALGLIPFQINAHFIDADPNSTHQGETRETRLHEFHEENDVPVLGIREGCWLNIKDNKGEVQGENGAVLFRRDQNPVPLNAGDGIGFLLN